MCAKLYDKKIIKNIKFIDGLYHEDNYYSLNVLFKSSRIKTIPKYTYLRRIREGANTSIMQNLNNRTYSDLLKNFKMFLEENKEYNSFDYLYDFMYRKALNYIATSIKGKEECKKAVDDFRKFKRYTYTIRKLNFLKYTYSEVKYGLYYFATKIYKLFKKN